MVETAYWAASILRIELTLGWLGKRFCASLVGAKVVVEDVGAERRPRDYAARDGTDEIRGKSGIGDGWLGPDGELRLVGCVGRSRSGALQADEAEGFEGGTTLRFYFVRIRRKAVVERMRFVPTTRVEGVASNRSLSSFERSAVKMQNSSCSNHPCAPGHKRSASSNNPQQAKNWPGLARSTGMRMLDLGSLIKILFCRIATQQTLTLLENRTIIRA